jgi:putative heme transporter
VAATIIVVLALGAVSEIVLPMTFAAVLAVIFKPLVGTLRRYRFKPTLAAGVVVLGLLALMTGVVVATVQCVTQQTDQINASVDAAVAQAVESSAVDQASLDAARAAIEQAAPMIAEGFLTHLVSGVDKLIGLASGLILAALITYYLLKDGTPLRRSLVARFDPRLRNEIDGFIGEACRILRDYGRGRTVMSGVVSLVIGLASLVLGLPLVFTIMVVNFIGGYIPYIGAFLGGGLAVIVALGDGRPRQAAIMLVVVLVSNLALENLVEPK